MGDTIVPRVAATTPGVICVQKGQEVQQEVAQGNIEGKAKPSTPANTPGVVLAQKGGAAVVTGQDWQKILNDWKGKPLECFHNRKNHNALNCPHLFEEESQKVTAANQAEWKAEAAAQKSNMQQQ